VDVPIFEASIFRLAPPADAYAVLPVPAVPSARPQARRPGAAATVAKAASGSSAPQKDSHLANEMREVVCLVELSRLAGRGSSMDDRTAQILVLASREAFYITRSILPVGAGILTRRLI